MSKKAKSTAKLKRLKAKRAAKAAQQARYASYKDAGITKGSKRVRLASKRRVVVRNERHAMLICGNLGCRRCCLAAEMAHQRTRANKAA